MSELTDNKIFDPADPDSNNFRVINDVGNYVNNVVVADEVTQSLIINKPDHKGNYIYNESGELKQFSLDTRFKVVDTLKGKGEKSVSELSNSGTGKRCFILGSGPSLLPGLGKIKKRDNDVYISVNVRPLKYVDCQYSVFLDSVAASMLDDVFYDGKRISIWADLSDYYLDWHECNYWMTSFSPGLAVWLGCYMGFDDVVMVGFDCYRGDAYCDDDSKALWSGYPMSLFINNWQQALDHCPNPNRIRVIDSPLWAVFGEYKDE